jgi:RNA polymerase sigma-B factor
VNAIDRYDPARGIAFSSYAVPTIAGEIKRYYRDKTWAVHVPRDLHELVLTVDRAVTDLERDLGRTPAVAQIAARLSLTDEDVLDALHAGHARKPASFDAPSAPDQRDPPPATDQSMGIDEPGFDRVDQRAALDHLISVLTPRERRVIVLRFEHELTQSQIAQHVGVSQMQVSRILRRSLDRLRFSLNTSQRELALH